jgi:hypothetical protein
LVGRATTDTLTNKTITDSTNNVTANGLRTATGTVSVSGATAPSAGEVLTATDATTATWQAPDSGVKHNWNQDGWTPFTAVTITADGAQSFTQSVSTGQGVLTGAVAGSGSLRRAYLYPGTNWADSEMTSVIWGPTGWSGTNAQQGHIHRVREISAGTWEGIAIWTSVVFGGDYSFLHCAGVRWDGTSLLQSSNDSSFGASDATYIDRGMRVVGHRRFSFGSWINEYTVAQPERLNFLTTSDIVTIASLSDATFNETNRTIAGVTVNNATLAVIDSSDTTAVSYTVDGAGDIKPSSTSSQKRWTPFVMTTRVIGGTTSSVPVEVKRWRLGDPEPDWGDARVRRGTVTSNGSVTSIALGPGQCALWGAHFHTSSSGAWGDLSFRKL